MRLFRFWARSNRASVAVYMAILLPVLITAIGMTIDLGQAYLVRERLSRAVDAAALAAAGSDFDGSAAEQEAAIQARVDAFMAANYPAEKIGTAYNINVEVTEDTVEVSANANFNTGFMHIIGVDNMVVGSAVTVERVHLTNIELAMALDLSGSMASGGRIEDLIVAANDMVDIIVSNDQSTVFSKVALVPYGVAVNVGDYADEIRGPYTAGTCTSPGCEYYKFKNPSDNWRTHRISTCVTERIGTEAYTDAAPSTAFVGRNYPSSGNTCLASEILPLTSNKTILHETIDAFVASGSTGGQIGVGWGWYMLSPNFGYLWPEAENVPAAYGTENLVKILVLMTDGEYNSPYCNGVIARDATSGSGSSSDHIKCNATNGDTYSQAGAMCTAMKAAGVIIYTIGFQIVDGAGASDLMAECATDATHAYLAADGEELQQVFNDIAGDVMSVYVSR
ncbi:MAG: pilus assembly protein TadG-related protein [Micavibrio sp.]